MAVPSPRDGFDLASVVPIGGWVTHRRKLLLVGLVGAVFIRVSQPMPAFAGIEEEAARQLELAEADLEAGRAEQAAAAAASALRLDPGLHTALVIKALAYRAMDRADEARSLLRTYLDLRGTLTPDPRVGPALVLLEAELSPFDTGKALLAAEAAIEALEIPVAEAHLLTVRASGVEGAVLQKVMELEALAAWTAGRPDDARQGWRALFEQFPESAVDPDLPPDPMRAMAEVQQEVRGEEIEEAQEGQEKAARASLDLNPPPPAAVVLLGVGGGVAAFGAVMSGVSHQRGLALFPSLEVDGASWDAGIGEYNAHRDRERVGVALSVAGSAAVIGGIVSAIVHATSRKKRVKAAGGAE